MSFTLDPKLDGDSHSIGTFKLCQVLLANDRQYPWFILVPKRENIREIFQLEREDQISLMIESNLLSKAILSVFPADKLNIASLGNIVPQLHIHHIARSQNDAAWPGPVWGAKPAVPYGKQELEDISKKMFEVLGNNLKAIPKA